MQEVFRSPPVIWGDKTVEGKMPHSAWGTAMFGRRYQGDRVHDFLLTYQFGVVIME